MSTGGLLLAGALPAWAGKNRARKDAHAAAIQEAITGGRLEATGIWQHDGCLTDSRLTHRLHPYVYNGNAYMVFYLPGFRAAVVKAPLDGGQAQVEPLQHPEYVTGSDPHRYYVAAADSQGYIHISGDMHSSGWVKHWISARPEDISEFIRTEASRSPRGLKVTYPAFHRSPEGVLYHKIRCAEPVWGIGISVLDASTQTWCMLGAEVPREDHRRPNKPMTAWEAAGEGGTHGYTQPHADMAFGPNKRIHFAFALLAQNTPSAATDRHTTTHIIYAYSDDGGKTVHRADGSPVQWPVRAAAGPYQGDIVYSETSGPPPWLCCFVKVHLDNKQRPVVSCRSHKTGDHSFVLENGKWSRLQQTSALTGGQDGTQPLLPEDQDDPDAMDAESLPGSRQRVQVVVPPQYHGGKVLLRLLRPVRPQGDGK